MTEGLFTYLHYFAYKVSFVETARSEFSKVIHGASFGTTEGGGAWAERKAEGAEPVYTSTEFRKTLPGGEASRQAPLERV